MKGLELSRKFYEAFGKQMLETEFSHTLPYIAVGLVGSGSECFGYDDNLSQDHDFEPGFCIFIPDETKVDRKTAFLLERAYAKLPKEFLGFKRNNLNPVGGNRHGIIRIDEFFTAKVGNLEGKLSIKEWFLLPEYSLAEATNGEIFCDNYGLMTQIRENLSYLPIDVKLKKLAGHLLIMGQSGQYNYPRCIDREDLAAAQLAIIEFVKSAINVVFLLNNTYLPYYKWQFHALKTLPILAETAPLLEFLISSDNLQETAERKVKTVTETCSKITEQLKIQNLTTLNTIEMEAQAYAVNDKISDPDVRNFHVLFAV